MSRGLLSVAEKYLCKLIYALFKLILIAVVADFKPFFYRCACHVVADDVFQDQGIMSFPEEGIALHEPFPSGVTLQEPVNPFPDIAVRWLCAVPFQSLSDQFPFPLTLTLRFQIALSRVLGRC